MAGSALVGVFDGVLGVMAVKPARRAVAVSQCHLRTMYHFKRLSADDGAQSTLQESKRTHSIKVSHSMSYHTRITSKLAWKAEDMAESCGPALISVVRWM